jgi:hypothetical protein
MNTNWRFILISCCLFLVSCNDENSEKEFYPGTNIFKYYPSGQLKSITKIYNSNTDYKVYKEFYQNGNQKYKDATFQDKWVGPIELYDSNGVLSLYNEIDINEGYFYVKKYKEGRLIKEEGLALSPILYDFSKDTIIKSLMFFYSEPPGYSNEIKTFIDNQEIKFIRMSEHHIGIISLNEKDLASPKQQYIIIKAILKHNNNTIDSEFVRHPIMKN